MPKEKERQVELLGELLTGQINHWLLFSVVLTIMGYLYTTAGIGKPDIRMWAFCGILPIAHFLVRAKIRRFLPFMLGSAAASALALVFPAEDSASRVVAVVCGVGYFVYSFVLRLRADTMYTSLIHPAAGAGISAAGVFLMHQAGSRQWDGCYTAVLLGCLAASLLVHYIHQYLRFLVVNASSTGTIPTLEMFRSGMGLVLGYVFVGTAVLSVFLRPAWLAVLFDAAKRGLLSAIRFLVSLIPASVSRQPELIEEAISQDNMEPVQMPAAEASILWKILEYVVTVLFVCLVVCALIRFVYWLVCFVRERFGTYFRNQDWGASETAAQEIREKCGIKEESAGMSGDVFGFLSPGERIRRMYRRAVRNDVKELADGDPGKLSLYTVREVERKLQTAGMASVYEKARYSGETVSREDVKKMRVALGRGENPVSKALGKKRG